MGSRRLEGIIMRTVAIAVLLCVGWTTNARAEVPPGGQKQVSLSDARAFDAPGAWLDAEGVRDVRRGIVTSVAIDKVCEGLSAARFVAKLTKSVWSSAKHAARKFVGRTVKKAIRDKITGKGR